MYGVGGMTNPDIYVKFNNVTIKSENFDNDLWSIRDDLKVINLKYEKKKVY